MITVADREIWIEKYDDHDYWVKSKDGLILNLFLTENGVAFSPSDTDKYGYILNRDVSYIAILTTKGVWDYHQTFSLFLDKNGIYRLESIEQRDQATIDRIQQADTEGPADAAPDL